MKRKTAAKWRIGGIFINGDNLAAKRRGKTKNHKKASRLGVKNMAKT